MRSWVMLSVLTATLVASEPKPLTTTLQRVRVHPDEAWITRQGRDVVKQPGLHRLLVGALPPGLTLADVRVQAKGPAGTRLGELRVGPDRRTPEEPAACRDLLKRLEKLHDRRQQLEAMQEAAQKSLAVLDLVSGNRERNEPRPLPSGSSLVDLSRQLESRTTEVNLQIQTRARELESLKKTMSDLEATWERLRGSLHTNPNPSAVAVELELEQAGEVTLELTYRTRQARWKPAYEVRLSEDGTQLEWALYAAITQASGEPWNGVTLELSNTTPSTFRELPRFPQPVSLGWLAANQVVPGAVVEVIATSSPVMDTTTTQTGVNFSRESLAAGYVPPKASSVLALEGLAQPLSEASGLVRTWRLQGLKEVPADGDAHRFRVQALTVHPTLHLVAVPRLDASVHQVARMALPVGMPLFPGAPLLRFCDTQRIGEGTLVLPEPGQPFDLDFGAYQGLRAGIETVREQHPFQITRRVETRSVVNGVVRQETKQEIQANDKDLVWVLEERLTVANDTDQPLEVEVQDRRIRSVHESVSIQPTLGTTPGATPKDARTQCWTVAIRPRGQVAVDTGVVVRSPKGGELTGLRELGMKLQ